MDRDCIHRLVWNFITLFLLVGKKGFHANPGHVSTNEKAGFPLSVFKPFMNSKAFSLKPQRKYSIITKLKYNLKTMNIGWTNPNQASPTTSLLPNQIRVSVPLRWRMQGLYCTYSRTYRMYFLTSFPLLMYFLF